MEQAIECPNGHKITSLAGLVPQGPYFDPIGKLGEDGKELVYNKVACKVCGAPISEETFRKLGELPIT
jgi:hypothetical protein